MNFIIGLIVGFITCFIISSTYNKKKKDKEEYVTFPGRRGLYDREYTVTNSNKNFETRFEIYEIESTDTLSKVKVISVKSSLSEYNSNDSKYSALVSMIDNSWIPTADIQWITNRPEERNNKIDKILNK